MNKSNFDLEPDDQRTLLRVAEDKLGLSDTIIEKDLWLCWLLEELFTLPLKMAFKGGTSFSKMFGLINRFSEDVDITIDFDEMV
jgi:predicted nucleotidyltransferase component of viral defense system